MLEIMSTFFGEKYITVSFGDKSFPQEILVTLLVPDDLEGCQMLTTNTFVCQHYEIDFNRRH